MYYYTIITENQNPQVCAELHNQKLNNYREYGIAFIDTEIVPMYDPVDGDIKMYRHVSHNGQALEAEIVPKAEVKIKTESHNFATRASNSNTYFSVSVLCCDGDNPQERTYGKPLAAYM